ncbi:MAG TPA: DUF4097 family beta strand repeat-containing protein [Bryobacteraceae bacterium]|nr:DUF4097 family beta strand repeat-containing protein [Bryobacteraceae bacterium]
MTRLLVSLPAALALLSLPVLADEWNKRFTINGAADLRVETNDGAVSVRAWDRKEIEARVTADGRKIAPGQVEVIDHQTGNHVELEVRVSHHQFVLGFGTRSVQVELQVPRDIRTEIHTGDGRVQVDGLHGETRLTTGDGSIEAENLDGTLEARTGDGRVRAQGRFDALDVHTGDGSVEVEASSGSKMTTPWTVRTGDGHVTLRLPSDFSAELDVRTGDGHIQSELPVTSTGRIGGDHALRGKLNAGGPPLMIRTNDGSITLARL